LTRAPKVRARARARLGERDGRAGARWARAYAAHSRAEAAPAAAAAAVRDATAELLAAPAAVCMPLPIVPTIKLALAITDMGGGDCDECASWAAAAASE
jgi:hypothetical protein